MTRPRGDTLAGAALLVLAVAVAFEARGFRVEFLTDPVGPRAFPWLAALLLGTAGVALLARPAAAAVVWPRVGGWRRLTLATVSFLAYAALLAPLGFVLATTLEVTLLSRAFGGRPWRSVLAAAAFSATLYLAFVYGLALSLPTGTLFTAWSR